MRKDILEKKPKILEWLSDNQSKAFMCRQLKCRPSTLNNWLEKLGITYSGNQSGKGIKKDPKRKTALEYSKSTSVKSDKLKQKLFEDSIKEECCERCNKNKWLGQQIPLELHHKDGDRFNNKFSNLEILCPNCHALTPYYRGRNK